MQQEPDHQSPDPDEGREDVASARPDDEQDDDLVDEMSQESFPTSDPPSTWGGADLG